MAAGDAVLWALGRNWNMVDAAIEDLDPETLARQPAPECNSIAWILWHMNRVIDTFINQRLQGREPFWITQGWSEKFGMADNVPGMGWTPEDLAGWSAPDVETLLGYQAAVRQATRDYIGALTYADMERPVTFPPEAETRDHTLNTALGQLVWDNVAHGGQIAYLRGLFQGMGWHR